MYQAFTISPFLHSVNLYQDYIALISHSILAIPAGMWYIRRNLRFSVLDQTEQNSQLCGQSTRPSHWCGFLDLRDYTVAPTPYRHIVYPRPRRYFSCGMNGRAILISHLCTPESLVKDSIASRSVHPAEALNVPEDKSSTV